MLYYIAFISSLENDECATAAEVYGCNNQKNPGMTSALFENINSSSQISAGVIQKT